MRALATRSSRPPRRRAPGRDRALVTLAVTVVLVSCTTVSACGGGCRDFVYDVGHVPPGEATPAAAVSTWASSNSEGAPTDRWTDAGGDNKEHTFVNGSWFLVVVRPPAGGWVVSEGTSCRS